jgi:adenylate cyclase
MEADEEGALARLERLGRDLIDPKVVLHKGQRVKTAGGMLIEFASAVEAVPIAAE